jgi:sec-independent protein translocase protein TatB
MLSLTPAKILVVLVVALIVLGPEKLPGVARQLGALWGDLRRWRTRLESEVRGVFPDLPPTHEVAQVVRSPLTFLNRLADEHERSAAANGNTAVRGADDGADVVVDGAAPAETRAGPGPPPVDVTPSTGDAPEQTPHGRAGTVWFATSVGSEGALPTSPDDPGMN